MRKKIISALLSIALGVQLIGCSQTNMTENNDKGFAAISNGEKTQSAIPPLTIPEDLSEIRTSGANETAADTSESLNNGTVFENVSESAPEESREENRETENDIPKWGETPLNGELYVNTDNIYSRIYAVQGSKKITRYSLNDKVTVTAKTDTGYYKLNDGTFIHEDYLSENRASDGSDTGSAEDSRENNAAEWTETALSGERYVNTDNIYSRISAVQGSEKVKRYKLNDKVTVTAKTDTDYYKLSDGTFIHADYLSESEIPDDPESRGADYTSVTKNGYVIERIDGITYVDGIMIANKTYTLPKSYDPGTVKEAADALKEMQNAAAADGLSLYVVSGYRSYSSQEAVYAGWVSRDGAEQADTYSSRAGHSDHQTGYTFDLNSLEQSFARTPEGIWLAEHCAEFGFIIRYPEGKEMYTGYIYEPWHVRYIGKEKAKVISESGLSLEEYYGITSEYGG